MPFASIIFTLCLITGIVYLVYLKRKERELIEQVTPITRGEWSERRVVLRLLKWVLIPKPYFMICIFKTEWRIHASRCSRCDKSWHYRI